MSKFWRWGKTATKLAMTCLSHMVLSPVGLQQIGIECHHLALAALRLNVRQGSPALAISPPCPAIFSDYSIPHSVSLAIFFHCLLCSPTFFFLIQFILFRQFILILFLFLALRSFSSGLLYPDSSSLSTTDTSNKPNNHLSILSAWLRQARMTMIFSPPCDMAVHCSTESRNKGKWIVKPD